MHHVHWFLECYSLAKAYQLTETYITPLSCTHNVSLKIVSSLTVIPLGKWAINELSKQGAKDIKHFRCYEYGHMVARCQIRTSKLRELSWMMKVWGGIYEAARDAKHEFPVFNWASLGVFTLHLGMRIVIDLAFSAHISHESKSYKVMIDGDSCVNIIWSSRRWFSKRNLIQHNTRLLWLIKLLNLLPTLFSIYLDVQFSETVCSVMFSTWMSWLYVLDVTSFGRSNTCEFKFNGKRVVLKSIKLNSSVKS